MSDPISALMSDSTSEWKAVCRVDDIPVLGARRLPRQRGGDIAIFRNADNKVFALLDSCPHKGGPLSQGIVFGESVACPLHNWTIGLADGCARSPDEGCTPRFRVMVDGGVVHVDVAEVNDHAVDAVLAAMEQVPKGGVPSVGVIDDGVPATP